MQQERALNIKISKSKMEELYPISEQNPKKKRDRIRNNASSGKVPKFSEVDFVFVGLEDFNIEEKLCLRWGGHILVTKTVNDYFFVLETLRNVGIQLRIVTFSHFFKIYFTARCEGPNCKLYNGVLLTV